MLCFFQKTKLYTAEATPEQNIYLVGDGGSAKNHFAFVKKTRSIDLYHSGNNSIVSLVSELGAQRLQMGIGFCTAYP